MSQLVEGRPIAAGYEWSLRIAVTADEAPFPADHRLVAQVRRKVSDVEPLATLSTDDQSIVRVDGSTIDIVIDGETSAAWAAGVVLIDVIKASPIPQQYLGIRLEVPVIVPVTRGVDP